MFKKTLILLIILIVSVNSYSQWVSSEIPDSLKINADAVVRLYESVCKIESPNKIVLSEKRVITVLNEKGLKYANFYESYDKNSKINNVKGVIYDSNGKSIKKTKRSDFNDVSIVSDFSLYEANRAIYCEAFTLAYPFTVEYEFEEIWNTSFYTPTWFPMIGYRIAVQNASLKVEYQHDNPIKYKSFNIGAKPLESKGDVGQEILAWTIKNRKALEDEPFSLNLINQFPLVFLASENFIFEGYQGSLASWNSYGQWLSKLLDRRQNLSQKTIDEILTLTKNVSSEKGKLKVLFNYLQSHTRYVSIQLGIGGFQPFPASDVEKFGYGDCKALTNYMQALLRIVGIDSYYCGIGVNRARIIFDDFPSNQIDHIILCVPIEKDTVWVECTNQNLPLGYVSHVKENQKVLLVDGINSRLVNMPKANLDYNLQSRKINIQLDTLHNAIGEVNTFVTGAECENLMPEYWSNKKEQLEKLQRKYRIPGIVFKEFEYDVKETPDLKISEKVKFTTDKLMSITGKRIFLPVNPFLFNYDVPSKAKKRVSDVLVDLAYTHLDTLVYNLPKGYVVEFLPKSKLINGKFGTYETSFKIEENRLIITRKYQQFRARYSANEYNNLIDFLTEVSKLDKQALVLVKKAK